MGTIIKTVLSDYKRSLLENLAYNIWVNSDADDKQDLFDGIEQYQAFCKNADRIKNNVKLAYIDWFKP